MNAPDHTLAKVIQILKDELHVESVTAVTCQQDLSEWDSMTYMSIVARIQDELGVEASPGNIESFGSVPDIMLEISKKKG